MAIITPYDRGAGPVGLFNITGADSIQNIFLGGASAESIVIPTTALAVMFLFDGPVYYRVDANPVVPTDEITSAGSILVPAEAWSGDNWRPAGRPTSVRFIRVNVVDTIGTLLFYDN